MTETTGPDILTVNVKELLKFFDEKPDWSIGHATGIVAVTGEDLSAACFQHYAAKSRRERITVVPKVDKSGKETGPHPVTTGNAKGPRLDRWMEVTPQQEREFLYQAEIKSWSAHAIGGEKIAVSATPQEFADHKRKRWERHWDSECQTLKHPHTAKVLVPMKKPCGYDGWPVKPLLIFWQPLGPKEIAEDHLFSLPVNYYCKSDRPASWPHTKKFGELWVFSVSSYLRSLAEDQIQLQMPNATQRLQMLNNLFLTGL